MPLAKGTRVKQFYRLVRDVTDDAYDVLLRTLVEAGGTFGLVWRDQLNASDSVLAVRSDLQLLEVRRRRVGRWPGTQLIGHRALIITYRSEASAFEVLRRPRSLFGWRAPDFPEDLWFTSDSGQLLLATVAHESHGWIFSKSIAKAIGQRVTLKLESRTAGDEQYFELAV